MDWDDLCWNLHEDSIQQGESSGKEAGSLAGFRDGLGLGQVKGFELGMEIGFIRGFLEALEEEESVAKNDRIQRSIDQLQKALEQESLQPSIIFQETAQMMTRNEQTSSSSSPPSWNENDGDSPSRESKADAESKLQRIRARFKVLIVQLKIPKSTLKDVMDVAAKSAIATKKEPSAPSFDGEW